MSIEQHYPAHLDQVKRRFDQALQASNCDAAIVYSGGLKIAYQDDLRYPFIPNHHFKEWVPLTNHPECFVVYERLGKPKLIYYQPKDYWHTTPTAPQGFWTDRFDIETIEKPEQAWELLPKYNALWIGPEQDSGNLAPKAVNSKSALSALHYERAYKTDYEVACISKANEVAALGHVAAKNAFFDGRSEFDINSAYLTATRSKEHQLPYGNIVALNEHGAILHYDVTDENTPAQHHSFLIDAGAQHHGYAADITRTYSFEDVGFEDLIQAMDEQQQDLIHNISIGQSYLDLHIEMHRRIAKLLNDFDIVDLSEEAMIANNVTSTFFPHGLGHHLGLCVHDLGGMLADRKGNTLEQPEQHPFLRNLRKVEVGNVLTIEPGLYFIDMLLEELEASSLRRSVNWARVEHLKKFGGIRIEDNVWISDQGPINLTRQTNLDG
ncbi:MAG: Xaa-Pro dipeptidase [Pseudomonadota bacterium]